METFSVIENGYNTCYIDSLLISLFYKNNTSIYSILDNEPKIPEAYYLQELIKVKFVDQIKKNYCIYSQSMNEIRNYSIICGYIANGNIDEQQNCIDYYNFFSDLFNIQPIEFEIFQIDDNIISKDTNKIKLNYISLDLNRDNDIRNLFINWLNLNIIIKNTNTIQCYKLVNIPQLLVFSINRKNNAKLDIMNKIKFFNINDSSQSYIKWKIHAIICKVSDHYYSVININKKEWLLFDDYLIPSFKKINLDDDDIKEKITSECVILIYSLD